MHDKINLYQLILPIAFYNANLIIANKKAIPLILRPIILKINYIT